MTSCFDCCSRYVIVSLRFYISSSSSSHYSKSSSSIALSYIFTSASFFSFYYTISFLFFFYLFVVSYYLITISIMSVLNEFCNLSFSVLIFSYVTRDTCLEGCSISGGESGPLYTLISYFGSDFVSEIKLKTFASFDLGSWSS